MSRPRAGNAAVNVSLFPFLAVLICTMGALILLLVVIAEQTRRNSVAAGAHQAESVQQQFARLADARQRLTQQRDELIVALARRQGDNAALQSATVAADDEHERLTDELAARTLLDDDSADDRRASLFAEIAEVDNRIAKSRDERDRLAGIADRGSKSFAVVPYQGQYGTRRRPLYIECTASSVILQPEGVLIDPADLDTPFGRTNPLSHAIEAASDHLLRLQHTDAGQPGIPYPLLLVRPGGIQNFYLARRALQLTASEFGYELIEGDWELDYPEVDAGLALVMSDAVKHARRAQMHLARSAPRLKRSSPFVEGTGDGGTGYGGTGYGGRGHTGRGHTGNGHGGGGSGSRENGSDENGGNGTYPGASLPETALPETAFPDGDFGGNGTMSGAVGSGSLARANTTDTTTGIRGTGSGGNGLSLSGASNNPTASGTSGSGTDGGAGAVQPPDDAFSFDNAPVATGSPSSQRSFDDPPTSASANSSGGSPGPQLVAPDQTGGSTGNGSSGSGSPVTPSAGGTGGAGASSGTGSPGGGSTSSAGAPGANASAGRSAAGAHKNSSSQSSQGRTRGTDNTDSGKPGRNAGEQPWALANTASGAVPVTRPIRVRINADRIALLSPDGRQERKVVRFANNARDTVGDVVSAVWDRTDSWGLAGRGLYWSPVLLADVAPDGVGRLEQLQRMLTGSGIELKPRAAAKSAARPVPGN